jgi:uncharacterized membrane protein
MSFITVISCAVGCVGIVLAVIGAAGLVLLIDDIRQETRDKRLYEQRMKL